MPKWLYFAIGGWDKRTIISLVVLILISISSIWLLMVTGMIIVTDADTNSSSASLAPTSTMLPPGVYATASARLNAAHTPAPASRSQGASYSRIRDRVETLTSQSLYDAREQNATRFDDRYKGKRIRIRGQVVRIDNGRVTLGVDSTGFGIDNSGLSGVDLNGLPRDVQIRLNRGQQFTAVCEVGNFIIGTIMMEDCEAR